MAIAAHAPPCAIRLATALLALVVGALASGCAAPRIERTDLPTGGYVALEKADWPRPTRLGVLSGSPYFAELDRAVVKRVANGVDHVVPGRGGTGYGPTVDHVLALEWQIEGDTSVANFFICFPGFVLFMPTWIPLRWEYEVVVVSRLLRPDDLSVIDERRRTAHFRCRYTPGGYNVACAMGWAGLLVPPAVIAPFVAGLVGVASPWDEHRFARALARDDAMSELAHEVAADVLSLVDEDLGRTAQREVKLGKK